MNKKVDQLTRTDIIPCFVVLFLFIGITAYFSLEMAGLELIIAIIVLVIYIRTTGRRSAELKRDINNYGYSLSNASTNYLESSPMAMMIYSPENGHIIWCNDHFKKILNSDKSIEEHQIQELIPGFDGSWLTEKQRQAPNDVLLNGRRYRVFGSLFIDENGRRQSATTYWLDVTEESELREKYQGSRPVVAIMLIDNYEELLKNLGETERAKLRSDIEARLAKWTDPLNGIFCRYDRDRYLFVFEGRYLPELIEQKFAILDSLHEVTGSGGMTATMSIGIGTNADTLEGMFMDARLSIDMALSRGGDQAVLKNKRNFEFYGGRAKEQEHGSRVKSRVYANSLVGLIQNSSKVLIMGHKSMDVDCVGAAAGVAAIARKNGRKVFLIGEKEKTLADKMLARLQKLPEYSSFIIEEQDAMIMADSKTLLVVVDTNRPEQVTSRYILESCNHVAVIDHHRRAATYIENTDLDYHEPFASSASEMVTELIEYVMEPSDLLLTEAEALYAGIVLDTKNFSMRTGARTFDKAAYLRRCGVDTGEIKKIFQNDLKETVKKYSIIEHARVFREGIAIADTDKEISRITAAQAADDLLNISGIEASFVVFRCDGMACISGRSLGDINVQIILEKLNGGGNATAAGAQLNESIESANEKLEAAVQEYIETA